MRNVIRRMCWMVVGATLVAGVSFRAGVDVGARWQFETDEAQMVEDANDPACTPDADNAGCSALCYRCADERDAALLAVQR